MFEKLRNSVSSLQKNMDVEKLKGAASNVTSKIAEKSADIKDIGVIKLKQTVSEVVASVSLIRAVGFKPKGISIKLGLSPTVSLKVEYMRDETPEALESVIARTTSEMIKVLLKTLGSIKVVHSALDSIPGLDASEFDVTLGLSPSIGMTYKISPVPSEVAALALADANEALLSLEAPESSVEPESYPPLPPPNDLPPQEEAESSPRNNNPEVHPPV